MYVEIKNNLFYVSRLIFVRNGMGGIFWFLVLVFFFFVVLFVYVDFVIMLNKKILIVVGYIVNKGKECFC